MFQAHRSLLLLIGLLAAFPAMAQTTLISTGAVWRYLDDGSDQGTAWRATGFPDGTWLSGGAQFGYGEADETTTLATTNMAGVTTITFYFRHAFNVTGAGGYAHLRARLKRDDGAIVYLNGTEVIRDNMPAGDVGYQTNAVGAVADDGQAFNSFYVPGNLLVEGANVIAVEVHQAPLPSSDVSFDFELIGNPLPSVAINSPTNTQTVVGTTVSINGTAVPAAPTVSLVEVYTNAVKLGDSANANFSVLWNNAAPGSYTLLAIATDSAGLKATSAPVAITVQAPPAGLLVTRGSSWKYWTNNLSPPTGWMTSGFDDSTWGSGAGPLGGGDPHIVSTVAYGPTGARFPTVYYRKTFNVANPSAYSTLTLRLLRDDGAAVYLNGNLLVSDGVSIPTAHGDFATQTVDGGNESTYFNHAVSAGGLVSGVNVLAVENKQVNATSSDLGFDLEVEGEVDTTPPVLGGVEPAQGSVVLNLTSITVTFDEAVTGVDAGDLLINNEPATGLTFLTSREYAFTFPQPGTGVVQVAFSGSHGITDTAPLANVFAGSSWSYTLDPNASTTPNLIISEFMADNQNGIEDEDGNRSDWVELYNLGPLDANLNGWFLTDDPTNLSKWRFPSVSLPANNYLLVWASEKNKTNPAGALHTSFKLSSAGGYLALVGPQTNVVNEFNPYPAQSPNISYGRAAGDPNTLGYFSTPTPRAQNSTSGSGFAEPPQVSLASGIYTNNSLTMNISPPPNVFVRYTYDGTDPTASSPGFGAMTSITFDTNMMIKLRGFNTNVSGLLPSPIVSRKFIMLDATTRNFSSDLPMLIISTHGLSIPANVVPGGQRRRGVFASLDTFRGRSSMQGAIDFQGFGSFEIVGQTSAGFAWGGVPKPPYRIELQDDYGNDRSASLLGLPSEGDWNLRNPFSDKCLMNDFLAYELWEEMGHYSCRRRLVELFVDNTGGKLAYPGDYYGVMVLFERIERGKDRVDINELTPSHTTEPDITGGYIFKKDKDSTGDLNFSTSGGAGHSGQTLKLHEPKPNSMRIAQGQTTTFPGAGYTPSASNQLAYLRGYLNAFEASMYAGDWTNRTGTNHYSHYINVDDFVDQHLHVEFTKQIDGYRISGYYNKPRGGKVSPSPVWDWNLSFGNANYLKGGQTNGWYWADEAEGMNSGNHIWLRRLVYGAASGASSGMPSGQGSGDPDFRQKITDRWAVLRAGVLNGDRITNRIQEIANQLNEAQGRNYSRYSGLLNSYTWPNPEGGTFHVDYSQPTYALIISNMTFWTKGRYEWMDAQFLRSPTANMLGGMVSPGTTVTLTPPPGASIYYTTDATDPRLPGGGISPSATLYTGPITINGNAGVFARARLVSTTIWTPWSAPLRNTYVVQTPSIVITEVMYHPDPDMPGGTNSEPYEYIEIKNTGGSAVNLQNFRISGGVNVALPNYSLAAGSYVVVVANTNSFRARYGNIPVIVGSYTTRLQNEGERVVLEGPVGEPIHDFRYNNTWYEITDGFGFSLVPTSETAGLTNWNGATGWRASAAYRGSPGTNDAAPPALAQVIINEALTHSDLPAVDAIELRNLSGAPADIGDWYLTDDFNSPQKYRFAAGTTIPGNGYLVVYETNFNTGPNAFSLSSLGDEVFLFSGNAGGNLTGYYDGFDFGAQRTGITFGRHTTSQGDVHFVAQASDTLGTANSAPAVGPVVITEVHYHPPDIYNAYGAWDNTEDEYIELRNITGSTVQLHLATNNTIVWKLRDAVDYSFPAGSTIAANGYALIVSFDPANTAALNAFRANNGVPVGIPVFGPYSGKLDNSADSVELARPDNPEGPEVPYVLVDKVVYSHEAPWPPEADGFGPGLQRIVESAYGNDPVNWAAGRTPGASYVPGNPPGFTQHPQDQNVLAFSSVTLSCNATGSPPISYQWFFNNNIQLAGKTNSVLSFSSIGFSDQGYYRCLAQNPSGVKFSSNAFVSVVAGPSISQQPTNVFLSVPPDPRTNLTGRTAIFRVVASSTNSALSYQWRKDGMNLVPGADTNIAGINSDTLSISNVSMDSVGWFSCAIADSRGGILSSEAVLGVKPYLLVPPTPLIIAAGAPISANAVIQAFPPPFLYKWQRANSFTNASIVTSELTNFVTFNSAAAGYVNPGTSYSNSYNLRLVVTNLATTAAGDTLTNLPVFTVNTNLIMVLADTDGDGIPNQFETAWGLLTNNAADGSGDLDGDGVSNADEFRANTDPTSSASHLRITESIIPGQATLTFGAVSNRNYAIVYTDALTGNSLSSASWSRLLDVLSRPTNHTVIHIDPNWTSKRFYRVETPRSP